MIIQPMKFTSSVPVEYICPSTKFQQLFNVTEETFPQISSDVVDVLTISPSNLNIFLNREPKYGFYYRHPNFSGIRLDRNLQEMGDVRSLIYKSIAFHSDRYYINSYTKSETGVTTTNYAESNTTWVSPFWDLNLGANIFLIIENPLINMTNTYVWRNGRVLAESITNTIFDFEDGANYSQTLVDYIPQGTGTKTDSLIHNFYLDHVALKNALSAKADSYTTVNFYHRDGTEWE